MFRSEDSNLQPPDYELVFSKLCTTHLAELIEVHRRWVCCDLSQSGLWLIGISTNLSHFLTILQNVDGKSFQCSTEQRYSEIITLVLKGYFCKLMNLSLFSVSFIPSLVTCCQITKVVTKRSSSCLFYRTLTFTAFYCPVPTFWKVLLPQNSKLHLHLKSEHFLCLDAMFSVFHCK